MPSYKLFYFNIRGRAEIIRLIFAAAGQPYEDVRIEFADWPNRKKEFKFGKLPVIEIDGERLNQSVAIMHYLANQFGLAGKTALDAAKCHAAVETMHDWVVPLIEKYMGEKDNGKRAEMLKKEIEPELKKNLTLLEGLAKEKIEKDKSHFLVAGQLTYADLAFHNVMYAIISWLGADYLKQFPHLAKMYDNVSSQPKIKEYVSKRPKTDF